MADSAEIKTLRFTDRLLADATSAKDRLGQDTRCTEYRRVYDGPGQWLGSRPPAFFANLLRNYIQRKVSLITDSKPEMMVVSKREDYGGPAKILTDTIRAFWSHVNLQDKVAKSALLCAIDGAVGFGSPWDPDLDSGRGNIRIPVYPIDCIFLDPAITAAEDLQEGEYVGVKELVPIPLLIEKFPGRGEFVKPITRKPVRRSIGVSGGRRVSSPVESGRRYEDSEAMPRAEVYKWMVKDYSKSKRTGELLYPNGRFIVRAGDVILQDEMNPNWDGQFDLTLWTWMFHYAQPWGESEVGGLRKPAEAWNRIGDIMVRNTITTGNVTIIGDMDALDATEWNKLDNIEALVIKKRFGRDLRRDPPPTMPAHMYQMLVMIPQVMEVLAGLAEVSPAGKRSPAGSMGALEGLQFQTLSLLRQTSRLLETAIERLGHHLISRILQYYTSDRVFAIVGPSNEMRQYVFKRAELLTNDKGESISLKNREEHLAFLREFAFKVTANSGLIQNRVQRVLIAQQLLQAHIVDRKFVLDTLGPELVPDGDAVLKRATAEMQAQAQMGMLEKGRRIRGNRRGTQLSPGTGG